MNEFEIALAEDMPTAPSWLQLGVFALDGSGSMLLQLARPDASLERFAPSSTKGAGVDAAVRDLVGEMRHSRAATNYAFSFVCFNDRVTDRRAPKRLLDLDLADSFDPTAHGVGGTAIHTGLDAAAPIVEQFLRDAHERELPASAVVVLLSDGEDRDDAAKTAAAAARVRELPATQLAACLFATHGEAPRGEPLLQSIVSEPRLYARVYDAQQVRKFFQASVTASGVALAVRG